MPPRFYSNSFSDLAAAVCLFVDESGRIILFCLFSLPPGFFRLLKSMSNIYSESHLLHCRITFFFLKTSKYKKAATFGGSAQPTRTQTAFPFVFFSTPIYPERIRRRCADSSFSKCNAVQEIQYCPFLHKTCFPQPTWH